MVVVGGIIGTVAEVGVTETQPVIDKRFTEFSSIDGIIKQFLQTTANGAESAWEQYIENGSAASWSGPDVLSADDPKRYGIFGTGGWLDQGPSNTPDMQMTMLGSSCASYPTNRSIMPGTTLKSP